jgi:hypothetical protein
MRAILSIRKGSIWCRLNSTPARLTCSGEPDSRRFGDAPADDGWCVEASSCPQSPRLASSADIRSPRYQTERPRRRAVRCSTPGGGQSGWFCPVSLSRPAPPSRRRALTSQERGRNQPCSPSPATRHQMRRTSPSKWRTQPSATGTMEGTATTSVSCAGFRCGTLPATASCVGVSSGSSNGVATVLRAQPILSSNQTGRCCG